ncbi:MAG: hypothetical protein MUD00_02770 [Candidatus Pacebacteria bacterium]|jgi:primosomal protein N' (replication factor Y)|nr:hypothetical protein [Candidatus Paceibacterota bacterium]
MKVVTVIPLTRGLYKEDLSYFTAHAVTPGTIVSVPLRKKIVDAVVIAVEHLTSSKIKVKSSAFALKKIHSIKGPLPFHTAFWNTLVDTRTYFLGTLGATLYSLVPKLFFDEYELLPKLAQQETPRMSAIAQDKLALMRPLDERIGLYRTLIRESFAKKESIYLCVPTVRDAILFYEALKKGIEEYIYLFHGELTPKKTLASYSAAVLNEHPVVIVGTGGYLAVPRQDIQTVIVERETSPSYRTIGRPHLDIRVFAEFFSRRIGARLIMADTFLRTETLHRMESGALSEMSRPSFHLSKTIKREIIDTRRKEDDKGTKAPFSSVHPRLKEVIEETTLQGGRSFIFTLRKGLAPVTQCGDCEHILGCEACGAPLVLYKESGERRIYRCNKCEKTYSSLILCPSCTSWKLVPLGIGTESVTEELRRLLPQATILHVDKEHTKTKAQVEKVLNIFYKTPGAILVGTGLALPYLAQGVDTVAVASFDSLFSVPSFRIGEKILSLVARLEESTTTQFLLQTKNTDDLLVRDIASGNLAEAYTREAAFRETLGFPPFYTFVRLSVQSTRPEETLVQDMAQTLFGSIATEVFSPVAHRNNKGVATHILLRIPVANWSPEHITKKPDDSRVFATRCMELGPAWDIVVDPEDILY